MFLSLCFLIELASHSWFPDYVILCYLLLLSTPSPRPLFRGTVSLRRLLLATVLFAGASEQVLGGIPRLPGAHGLRLSPGAQRKHFSAGD